MNENTKTALTALVGIFIGALVTYLGVEKLTEKAVETSMKLGAINSEVEELRVTIAESKTAVNAVEEEVEKTAGRLKAIKNSDQIKFAEQLNAIEKLTENSSGLITLRRDVDAINLKLSKPEKWPSAINCGSQSTVLFVLHGGPIHEEGLAWYVQVYPDEFRYVRFKGNGLYHDKAGHNDSSIGCKGKSISQLRKENRAYQFVNM